MNTIYVLDNENRIIGTGGAWDEFAQQNDGAAALSEKVVGHRLWDFVEGFEVQSFLNAFLISVRTNQAEFDTIYRCDGDDIRRLFLMTATPLQHGLVQVQHQLLRQSDLVRSSKGTNINHDRCYNRCSMCCHFMVGGEWVDPFVFPEQLYFTDSHVICPSCKVEARRYLEEMVKFEKKSRTA